jgi:hypothetical protein
LGRGVRFRRFPFGAKLKASVPDGSAAMSRYPFKS